MAFKYPKTHSAANRTERTLWDFSDALLEECGPPGMSGVNDNSYVKIREAQQELALYGLEYKVGTLSGYRATSFRFPPDTRVKTISYQIHAECGTPEVLNAILAGYPKNTPPSRKECRRILREWRRQRDSVTDEEREAQHKKAQEEVANAEEKLVAARQAERKATKTKDIVRTAKEREEADENLVKAQQQLHNTPKRPKGNPLATLQPDQVPQFLLISKLLDIGFKAQSLAGEAEKMLEKSGLYDFDPDSIGAVIEAALNAHNKWNEFARTLQKLRGGKGAQFSVVTRG